MMPVRSIVLLVSVLSAAAAGQTLPEPPLPPSDAPEEETTDEAGPPLSPPPSVDAPVDAGRPRASTPLAVPPLIRIEEDEEEEFPPPEPPNEVSMFGAPSLGARRGGIGLAIGFPYVSARVAYGVLSWLDVGVSFDTMYGAYSDLRGLARLRVIHGEAWSVSLVADGGRSFFNQPAHAENRGPRYLTGRRNWNLAPGLLISVRGDPRAARLFADLRYHVAFDTEPFQRDPLGGVPAAVQLSQDYLLHFGAEFPLSRWTSTVFTFGLDIHGRPEDIPVLPTIAVGLVTSLF